jgi:hypothetical protein
MPRDGSCLQHPPTNVRFRGYKQFARPTPCQIRVEMGLGKITELDFHSNWDVTFDLNYFAAWYAASFYRSKFLGDAFVLG